MMKVMAIDYARLNIRVNMVVPGFIDTPMAASAPVMADPKELAYRSNQFPSAGPDRGGMRTAAILWLRRLTKPATRIGTTLVVDGGQAWILPLVKIRRSSPEGAFGEVPRNDAGLDGRLAQGGR